MNIMNIMNDKKRIGIITFATDAGKSGISQYLFNILENLNLSDQQHEYELIVHESESHLFNRFAGDNVNIIKLPDSLIPPVRNILWHIFKLPKLSLERKYDVVFLPAANRRAPYFMPCPTIGTVHDLASMNVKDKYDFLRGFYVRRILPLLIKRLSRILTVSEHSKKDIINFCNIVGDTIKVTPLAADKNIFKTGSVEDSKNILKEEYALDKEYILYISRLEHPGKNHIRLIDAFDILKSKHSFPHQLVFAGALRERGEEVIERIKQSPYSQDIKYFEFVDKKYLQDFYRAAELFVFPSLYEGFGLPVLESMACGTPVTCSNCASIPEVANNAALLFNPYDIDDIAESIGIFLVSKSTRDKYSKLGLERANMFSWEETTRLTLAAMEELII